MKVGRAFSIFACLLFSLQLCDAVICPDKAEKSQPYRKLVGNKTCSDACVYVVCFGIEHWGCTDVIHKCRLNGHLDKNGNEYFKDEFEFISQHNPNALMFKNNTDFYYISGCADEKEGYECIEKKMSYFVDEINEHPREGVFWHSSDDGVKGNGSLGDGNSDNGGGTNNGNTNGNDDGTSVSNSQNGAFKFVEIIAIVWILATTWIY